MNHDVNPHGLPRKPARLGLKLVRRLFAGGALALSVWCGAVAADRPAPRNSDELYQLTNVWTVHLKFAPDQWEAMEPKQGFGTFGGPGPFGRGPGGPGGFSFATFLSPAFVNQGDTNRDGRLSRAEFVALGEKWFAAWDTNHTGSLDVAKVRAGLNAPADSATADGRTARRKRLPTRQGMSLQGPEGKRNGLASAMGIEFVYVHADLEFEGRQFKDVGVRYKGNGTFLESRGSLKRSLKIDLDKYAKDQRLGDVAVLTLQNNVTDASWMNEVLSYRLYRDAQVPAPRTAYAKVYVTVPGEFERKYFGLYSLSEAVDKHFAAHRFQLPGGAIFKPVTPALFDDLGPDWARYNQTYDPKTPLDDEQKRAVIQLCDLVTNADDAEFAAKIGSFLDLEEFARYLAVMVWLSDLDGLLGPGQNFFLYRHPKTRLLQFIPWDQDHSFGQFVRGTQEQREQLSLLHPWQDENFFLERLLQVEAFKKLYLARLDEYSRTIFSPERLAQQVDEVAAAIRPAVQEESAAMLAKFDKVVAGEAVSGGGFGPFAMPGFKPIKPFAAIRTRSVLDQLSGKSPGLVASGFGFPGGGERGRRGQDAFGPGMLFADSLVKALDANQDAALTREEFTRGFARWFEAWDADRQGTLTEEQVRAGIDRDLAPFQGGFPPFGQPPAANPRGPEPGQ